MSKTYWQSNRLWIIVEDQSLTLPQFIEGKAKGWIRLHTMTGKWAVEIRQHKPKHTKGRKPRYYYVGMPEKRPLVSG